MSVIREQPVKVGIMSREAYKQRTLAIARGERSLAPEEPRIWFESLRTLAQVLSEENRQLLRQIVEQGPRSLAELERLSGRARSNLSRTLHTLERYGIVELRRENNRSVPHVLATEFEVRFGLEERSAR